MVTILLRSPTILSSYPISRELEFHLPSTSQPSYFPHVFSPPRNSSEVGGNMHAGARGSFTPIRSQLFRRRRTLTQPPLLADKCMIRNGLRANAYCSPSWASGWREKMPCWPPMLSVRTTYSVQMVVLHTTSTTRGAGVFSGKPYTIPTLQYYTNCLERLFFVQLGTDSVRLDRYSTILSISPRPLNYIPQAYRGRNPICSILILSHHLHDTLR
ncbi:hypothetical protein J3F83DRAFT_396739 [Trichoderma novae-zelandiae]